MSRGVQNVDAESAVLELHDGGGHGNTTLLFDLHPVGGSGPGILLSLDHAGLRNGAAVKQELFRQSRFTGIRVGNNGKGTPPADFLS